MIRRRVTAAFVALGLAVISVPAMASNTVTVTNQAAIEGNFGMSLNFDGSTNKAYVQDNSPSSETVYRASFWVDLGTLSTTNCGPGCVTQFMTFAGLDASTGKTVFRIIVNKMLAQTPGGEDQYLFRFSVRNDFGSFLYVGGTILTPVSVRRKHVTIQWEQGDPSTPNGVAKLYTSNDGGVPNLQATLNYANGTYVVDQVLWGAVAGTDDQASDAQTTGSLYYDSFVSVRTPLP